MGGTPEITDKISGIEILLFAALAAICVGLIWGNIYGKFDVTSEGYHDQTSQRDVK